jgi:PIN domain nuclease of toxin-antitoxin system
VNDRVLDASALLALLNAETGSEIVRSVVAQGAVISAVNLSEVVARLADQGMSAPAIQLTLDVLRLSTVDFDRHLALEAGLLRPLTRAAGLSLGDRACLATARGLGLRALTADRTWSTLGLNIPIQVIR